MDKITAALYPLVEVRGIPGGILKTRRNKQPKFFGKFFGKKGFSKIELLAVMLVIAILVTLAVPLFRNHTAQARDVLLANDAKLLEDAGLRYYIRHGYWPKAHGISFTKGQLLSPGGRLLTAGLRDVAETEPYFYERIDSDFTAVNGINHPKIDLFPVEMSGILNYANVNSDPRNFVLRYPDGHVYIVQRENNVLLYPGLVNEQPVTQITTGEFHSFARRADGTLWAWGYNFSNQLLDGTTDNKYIPVRVSGAGFLADITAVSATRGFHSLAVSPDGTLWAWGRNYHGQLGDGTVTNRLTPVGVLNYVVSGATGSTHTLAVRSDGTVWAWGANPSGQLGDDIATSRLNPTQVNGLTNAVAVSAGNSFSVALRSDGSVWAWGSNNSGQLGNGTITTGRITVPVQVRNSDGNLTGIVSIATGQYHTLALRSDGTVWAWGWNQIGQLGDGTTDNRAVATQPHGLTNIIAIAAGASHSLALCSNGYVWAWGDGAEAQLGNGTMGGSSIPTRVIGPRRVGFLSNIISISTGNSHSLALRDDGTVWAWGNNDSGQLGDGTTTRRSVPVQTAGLNQQ